MKRALFLLSMVAFLAVGVGACAPKPAAQIAPTPEPSRTNVAVQAGGATNQADALIPNVDSAEEGEITPPDALKLILLQWLVAR